MESVCVLNTWLIVSNHKTGRIYVVCPTDTPRDWNVRWYYYKSSFYPEEVVSIRTALFRDVTQRVVVTPYRHFEQHVGPETSLRNHQKMTPLCCPETSVSNYHYLLRNSSEERSFHTAYPSHLEVLKMGPIGCPIMSVRSYHYSLRNIPEECSSCLLCGWTLKSREAAAGFSKTSWRAIIERCATTTVVYISKFMQIIYIYV